LHKDGRIAPVSPISVSNDNTSFDIGRFSGYKVSSGRRNACRAREEVFCARAGLDHHLPIDLCRLQKLIHSGARPAALQSGPNQELTWPNHPSK
jgi:hypothetical protein